MKCPPPWDWMAYKWVPGGVGVRSRAGKLCRPLCSPSSLTKLCSVWVGKTQAEGAAVCLTSGVKISAHFPLEQDYLGRPESQLYLPRAQCPKFNSWFETDGALESPGSAKSCQGSPSPELDSVLQAGAQAWVLLTSFPGNSNADREEDPRVLVTHEASRGTVEGRAHFQGGADLPCFGRLH